MRIAPDPIVTLPLSPLVTLTICAYDKCMNITLTPEMEALIRHYMAHGSYPSPESVVMQALVALREVEAMHTPASRRPATGGHAIQPRVCPGPVAADDRRAARELGSLAPPLSPDLRFDG